MRDEGLDWRVEGFFLLRQNWREYEADGWDGLDSFSLHRSAMDHDTYVRRKEPEFRGTASILVPEGAPYRVLVTPSLYERVCASEDGILLDWKKTAEVLG